MRKSVLLASLERSRWIFQPKWHEREGILAPLCAKCCFVLAFTTQWNLIKPLLRSILITRLHLRPNSVNYRYMESDRDRNSNLIYPPIVNAKPLTSSTIFLKRHHWCWPWAPWWNNNAFTNDIINLSLQVIKHAWVNAIGEGSQRLTFHDIDIILLKFCNT